MGHVGAKMANKMGKMANMRGKMGARRRNGSAIEIDRRGKGVLGPLKGLTPRSIEAQKLVEYAQRPDGTVADN